MIINNKTLKNKRFIITRPSHQAESLQKKLSENGAEVILFPLLSIKPPDNLTKTKEQLSNLQQYNLIIFVSHNAVEQALKLVDSKILSNLNVAVTGKKTAQTLNQKGITVHFCPNKTFNSEALLAIPFFLEACRNYKVAIIRGAKGRDYLRDQLTQQGAQVDYIDTYQRCCPQTSLQALETHDSSHKTDMILLTSGASVEYFFNLASKDASNSKWLESLTLLLGSPRMQKRIPDSFHGKLLIADDPSDETLYKKLMISNG